MKKYIKTAIYLLINVLNIILTTFFLKYTMRATEDGFLNSFQFYTRLFCAILIFVFIFLHIFVLFYEHISKRSHSIFWEIISLVILFIAFMANLL